MSAASESMSNFAGYIVDERYELIQMLGTGSYGVVYKAVDLFDNTDPTSLHRAIKIIRKAGRKPSELEAVHKEVTLHSMVSGYHNIVRLYDAFEDEEFFYIVLDLCEGGDLYEQICQDGMHANNDERLRKTFLSLIDAVQTCHKARVFHRDLKPENILTNEDGSEIYLADFGLATTKTIANEHGCGTEYYMSPECMGEITGYKPYCTRFSDIWSLGVILINMMCGRIPWMKPTMDDECFARFLSEPNFFKEMLPITDGANAILQRIFAMNPLHRITLSELRRAVRELDAFLLTEDELAGASEFARIAAATIQRARHVSSEYSDVSQDSLDEEEMDIGTIHFGRHPFIPSVRQQQTSITQFEITITPQLPFVEDECYYGDSETIARWNSPTSSVSSDASESSAKLEATSFRRAREEQDIGEAVWKKARYVSPSR